MRARGLTTEAEARYLDEYELLTLARVRLAEGALAGVSQMLERLLALAETQKRNGSVIEIRLTQALIEQAQHNRPGALAVLESASRRRPEGYLRTFVDDGQAMWRLLLDFRAAIETRGRPEPHPLLGYVNRLLAAFAPSLDALPQSKVARPAAAMVDPVSERELEVLQLMAQGLTNREISDGCA